ncbi:hypothetical protein TNCT_432021 [Trichonephila clavata]|uniref:Uncharacterized protein n=1 Tax=Trichonephila clavata TaxID=2740835 RepID=A0A8X6I8C4_TRICU|nr:hypothetical protein TNCT_432021 [Trichonephila clavata]
MGLLKSKELSESLKFIIKNIQRTSFSNEIQYLEKGIPLPNPCAEATLANIRNNFWIPSARNVVRKILRTYICITCRKVSAKGSQQLMADLPSCESHPLQRFQSVDLHFMQSIPSTGRESSHESSDSTKTAVGSTDKCESNLWKTSLHKPQGHAPIGNKINNFCLEKRINSKLTMNSVNYTFFR